MRGVAPDFAALIRATLAHGMSALPPEAVFPPCFLRSLRIRSARFGHQHHCDACHGGRATAEL